MHVQRCLQCLWDLSALFLLALWASVCHGRSAPVWQREWPQTDFSTALQRAGVSARSCSGGPPKDGIPAIDDPGFVAAAQHVTAVAPL